MQKGFTFFEVLIVVAAVAVIVSLVVLGVRCPQETTVIREYNWIEVPVTEYVIVDKPIVTRIYNEVEKVKWVQVIVKREVEIKVEVPIELRDFESVEELREWLGEECRFILGWKLDCDDYARWLQNRAFNDGYVVNFVLIRSGDYSRLFKRFNFNGIHAMNSTIIGNGFYYIEPQTGEIVRGGSLD